LMQNIQHQEQPNGRELQPPSSTSDSTNSFPKTMREVAAVA
jgi:hypothetical protein